MPRKTSENFTNTFAQMRVDYGGKGPQVSDDIQMVYQLDDFSETLRVSAGIGKFRSKLLNNNIALDIECRNRRGLILTEIIQGFAVGNPTTGVNAPPRFGMDSSGSANPLTSVQVLTPSLTSGGTALARVTSGYVTTAFFNATNLFFMQGLAPGWGSGFHLEFGQFLHVITVATNENALLNVRWQELDRLG